MDMFLEMLPISGLNAEIDISLEMLPVSALIAEMDITLVAAKICFDCRDENCSCDAARIWN
jgi:hypothetical protein